LVGEDLFNRLNWFLFYERNKELILTIESIRSYNACLGTIFFPFFFLNSWYRRVTTLSHVMCG
jgi:hypothetical protein